MEAAEKIQKYQSSQSPDTPDYNKTALNLIKDQKAIKIFREHARLQVKHAILIKRTKIWIYRKLLKMTKEKMDIERTTFDEALFKIEEEDFTAR